MLRDQMISPSMPKANPRIKPSCFLSSRPPLLQLTVQDLARQWLRDAFPSVACSRILFKIKMTQRVNVESSIVGDRRASSSVSRASSLTIHQSRWFLQSTSDKQSLQACCRQILLTLPLKIQSFLMFLTAKTPPLNSI